MLSGGASAKFTLLQPSQFTIIIITVIILSFKHQYLQQQQQCHNSGVHTDTERGLGVLAHYSEGPLFQTLELKPGLIELDLGLGLSYG